MISNSVFFGVCGCESMMLNKTELGRVLFALKFLYLKWAWPITRLFFF
jgi:hypothetical protein